MTYFGFSGYATSVEGLADAINYARLQGWPINTVRVSGTPPYKTQGNHAFKFEYIDWLLTNTNFIIIADPIHIYPPDASEAQLFLNNLQSVRARLLEVANRYRNQPRVFIEIVNEFVNPADGTNYQNIPNTYSTIQGLVNDVRAVCSNMIVWNKQPPSTVYQPLENCNFQGDHGYFGDGQYSNTLMLQRLSAAHNNLGLEIICTEVGADWNEGPAFTDVNVDRLNWFLENCNAQGFGVCIWLRELNTVAGTGGGVNLNAYATHGLVIPGDILPPPPPPPPPAYACPWCDLSFESEADLAVHIRAVHPEVQPPQTFPCPFCDLVFTVEAELATHIRTAHPEEQPPPPVHAGCFIATACGTNNLSLNSLRKFRDERLPVTLVNSYYLLSPPLAAFISSRSKLKFVGRRFFEGLAHALYPEDEC